MHLSYLNSNSVEDDGGCSLVSRNMLHITFQRTTMTIPGNMSNYFNLEFRKTSLNLF